MAQATTLDKQRTPAASIPTFCNSLRNRQEWKNMADILLRATPKWRESRLNTHDIAIPVDQSGSPPTRGVFRFILLSQDDIGSEQTEKRLDRLSHLTGGTNVGIVFLLGKGGNLSGFMQLQLDTMGKFDMPLLPLSSTQALPTTLDAFQLQLRIPSHPPRLQQFALRDLLLYSSLKPHLNEHQLNVLSDITHSFKDLANKVTTEEGKDLLEAYLDDDADRIFNFWMFEHSL